MKKSRQPKKGEKLDTTPRIRAFRYSTKNKSDAAYKDRLNVLKQKYGVSFPFPVTSKLTGRKKAAITRRLNKVVEFLNPDNGFTFVPLTPATLRKVSHRRETAKEQRTGKGVFLPRPKGSRRKTSVRVDKRTGEISTKTGRFTSKIKIYKATSIIRNPSKIIEDAKKLGAEAIFVSIKGHRGKSEKYGYSMKHWMRYQEEQIMPDLVEAQDEGNYSGAFRNWFGVEYVIHDWEVVGKKQSRRKTNKKK